MPPGALYIIYLRRRTRFTEIGTFIFLSGPKFPRNRWFFTDSAKTGSAGAEWFRAKSYVPAAISDGIWIIAIGLPVLTGHRRVCHFFVCFLCARQLLAPTGHSFLDIAMKLCRHIALVEESILL